MIMAMIRPETEMKDSGVQWIGDIPKSWGKAKFKYFYINTNAGEVIDKNFWNKGKELLYTCQKTPMFSDFKGFPDAKRTNENDLLLTRNATPYIFVPEPKSIYSNVVQRVNINLQNDRRYLKYALMCGVDAEKVNGNTIPSWNMQVWNNIFIPLAELSEQQVIADYLDETCSQIDEIIAEAKASIDEYKELKQSVIFEAVTKGLDKNVEMKDSGVEWIGNTNKNAVIKKIKYTSNISRGLFNYRPRNAEFLYGGIHPFIQTGDVAKANKYVTDYKQTLSDEGTKISKFFPKGTLTMTIAANVGDVSILGFDAYFPDSVLGITPFNKYSSEYLYYVFSSMKSEFVRVSISNTQLNLNVERVKELFVPIFEDSVVQKKIVEYLDEKCSTIDSLISEKESLINDLEVYKKSLIYEVVTGKRRVV